MPLVRGRAIVEAVNERKEERFATEVLRHVLGIRVTQRDDGSAEGMVDALFPGVGRGGTDQLRPS